MPGVFQLSPDELLREASQAHGLGVPAILVFGIPASKDAKASGAYARNGIVQQTVRLLKKELPELVVITDVCLCEYMSHGHCGIVQRDKTGARIWEDDVRENSEEGMATPAGIISTDVKNLVLNFNQSFKASMATLQQHIAENPTSPP